MKASPITTSGASTTFIHTYISPVTVFMTTIAALIISVFKKRATAAVCYILDRKTDDITSKAKVHFTDEAGSLNLTSLTNFTQIFKLKGTKQEGSSALIWGFALDTTPALILSTINSAIDGLDWVTGVEATFDELIPEVKALCVPEILQVAPRSSLEKILDLLIIARQNAGIDAATERLAIQINQDENQATLVLGVVLITDFEDMIADLPAAPYLTAEMNAPENAAAASAVPRLALE